jgi:hypothetical protein
LQTSLAASCVNPFGCDGWGFELIEFMVQRIEERFGAVHEGDRLLEYGNGVLTHGEIPGEWMINSARWDSGPTGATLVSGVGYDQKWRWIGFD